VAEALSPGASRATAVSRVTLLVQALLPIALVALLIGFALAEPRIVSSGNLVNILIQGSYLAVFASAQMMVIITRGFDLSLGTCVSSVSVIAALAMTGSFAGGGETTGFAIAMGVVLGLGMGLLVGLFNGFAVAFLRVNPFVATLGSLNICLGIATMASDGRPVFNVPREFSTLVYNGSLFGVPAPLVLAALLLIGLFFLLNHTVYGRALYIIGGNPQAAAVAGLPSRRYLLLAYVICSLIAALGALMLTGRTGSGEPNLGGNLTLESIAAAVIGGVSLRGGIGGVQSVILGALFVTVLSNGMNLTRIDGNVQMIVLGCVIILAVFLDRFRTGTGTR
jgi:ribose transport system permease protein